jgi:hypothetical protein
MINIQNALTQQMDRLSQQNTHIDVQVMRWSILTA